MSTSSSNATTQARIKLVLLPGLDGTGVLFRPLLSALPPDIEPVVISYPTQEALGYDELLALVTPALPQGDFVLLGESFGGPLSLRIAASKPVGLRGLVLSASFVTCPYDWLPLWMSSLVPAFPFRHFPAFARLRGRLGGYGTSTLSALSTEALTMVAPEVFAHRVRQLIRVSVEAELGACAVPLMYLRGEQDHVVPASNLARVRRLRPDTEVVRLPAPHLVLQVRPQESAQALAAFCRRVLRDDMSSV
ncbi:alpha/beta fold hydrolase [Uliginosibacterium sp. H1]|uniref:alpha/beta fold hydrolase n=1 Tax=Uliginosibacterium sp. H1 TaxID=3114757 RepID=UPI002E188052|nr:alpha/beta fold hydrolase [Uliginosibacterium sp. H1]